jgi:hypothetical protein
MFHVLLIDRNFFEKQVVHDTLPNIYKLPVVRKLVSFDWKSSTTLEDILKDNVGMKDCGCEIKVVEFERTNERDYYGRHIYREILE